MGAVAASLVLIVGLTFIVRNIPHEDRVLSESTVDLSDMNAPVSDSVTRDLCDNSGNKDTATPADEGQEQTEISDDSAVEKDTDATESTPATVPAQTSSQTTADNKAPQVEAPTDTATAPVTAPNVTDAVTTTNPDQYIDSTRPTDTTRPPSDTVIIGSPADKVPSDTTTDTPDTTGTSQPEETTADNKNNDRPGDIPKWDGYNYTFGSVANREPKYTDDLVISCSEHVSTFHMIPKEFHDYVGDSIYNKWRKRATSMQCCYANTIWDFVRYCGISRSQFEEIAGCSIFTWYLDNADIIYNSEPAEFGNLFRVDK